jgi:hypothetical protein
MIHPYAPFTGVLLLPDRGAFEKVSAVTLSSGEPVASIQWHSWSMSLRFDILDPTGTAALAHGYSKGFFGRRFHVDEPRGEPLLKLELGFWGLASRCRVSIPTGQLLTTKGNWTGRTFSISDDAGRPVARILNTSPVFSWRPDSLAFEIQAPILSAVQAIGLAQCLRAAAKSQRSAAAAS